MAVLVYCGLTGLVAGFHLCLILGAPWGHLTMGGRWPGRLSTGQRLVSALSIAVLTLLALIVAARGGLLAQAFPDWAIWAVLAYLALAIIMHVATPSAAERRLWLPVILGMTAAVLVVEFA